MKKKGKKVTVKQENFQDSEDQVFREYILLEGTPSDHTVDIGGRKFYSHPFTILSSIYKQGHLGRKHKSEAEVLHETLPSFPLPTI